VFLLAVAKTEQWRATASKNTHFGQDHKWLSSLVQLPTTGRATQSCEGCETVGAVFPSQGSEISLFTIFLPF